MHPEAMRVALARHDALLRDAISRSNGHVFKTMGDAFLVAYATPQEAVLAAVAAQVALQSEPWPESLPIKVRMALHTGAVEVRDDDYFGQPLNRTARLLATAHGGQTLVSGVTLDLCRDTLPPTVTAKSLGEHLLKDLERPETIYQLLCPGLTEEFPPLRSMNSAGLPNNLPRQTTSLIGREKEVDEVKKLIATRPLVTLTGTGGCGKTRLSMQVAMDHLDGEGDGIWLIELAALSDPTLVSQAVADVVGVKEEPGTPIRQSLIEWLENKDILLVLDNCEHLLDECARLADAIIRSCPRVKILASSREALGISGEQGYRVPSLATLDPARTYTVERLSQYAAATLFLDRARMARQDFAITGANAPAVVSLCHQLGGIPLAIELAAARVRSLSVEEINDRLQDQFRFLTGGSRTALPRQQTLRALFDWSYDFLSENEKAMLRRLSVFAGGWTLAAAGSVMPGIDTFEAGDLLSSLVDKSLVVFDEPNSRYHLLETMRQYGRDRLLEEGESEWVQARHRDFFVALAEEAEPHLTGPGQTAWLERLEKEHDNFRAALQSGDAGAGLRLCGALWRFWELRDHLGEGRHWCALALAHDGEKLAKAKATHGAGVLAWRQGDFVSSEALCAESLAVYEAAGDRRGVAAALNNLGNVVLGQGRLEAARKHFEDSLDIKRELNDRRGMASSLKRTTQRARFILRKVWRFAGRSGTAGGLPLAS
jgi:predicted ATPase